MTTHVSPEWQRLVVIEPRLDGLLAEARSVDSTAPDFDETLHWDRGIKPQLIHLVGWYAHQDDTRLTTSEAYNTAVNTLYPAILEKAA
jgi:hypothetical protein